MIKLVIFDLDGTLLDTIEDITYSLNLALQDANLNPITVDECKYMVGSGVKVLIERAIPNEKYYAKVYDKYMYYYEKYQKNKTKPYPFIIDTLKAIKDENLKLAVLSNKPHDDALRVVDYYFGLDKFDLVLGKKENNRRKPHIDGCLEILDTLKINNNEVLYVGDTNIDMETANNAAFIAVAVSWGFRLASELKGYDYLIDNPKELLKIIEELK
ncbi:MAG TPA: HAD family hydrolase [Acholeplasmataceae bacterium]|nr:HAD family hydrolase [Acholeplasmataceae bacterium]